MMIACPSCGRDNVGVENLAVEVEGRLEDYPQAFEVAVMGCAVNGPGEAGDADFGIAGGRDVGFIYAHGRVLKKVSSETLVDELFREIDDVDRRGHAPAEAPEDGEAGRAGNGRGLRNSARLGLRDRCGGPPSSSCRPCARTRPTRRRSATSCSSAAASSAR